MAFNYSDAVDEMFGMINAAWPAVAGVCGYTPEIRWPGLPISTQVPMDKIWARPSAQVIKDSQASLTNGLGDRLYEAYGLLYLQIFCPRNIASTLDFGRSAAQIIQKIFRKESPSGTIWFRNQRIIEMPCTEENYPVHFIAEFTYRADGTGAGPITMTTAQKHYPVEAKDGIRTTFTFPGLPADSTKYLLIWNFPQDGGFVQNGDQITMDGVPNPPLVGDSFFVWY